MSRKFNEEEIREQIFEAVGNKYEMIGEYKNKSTKVLMRCNTCKNEWMVSVSNLLGNRSKRVQIAQIVKIQKIIKRFKLF